MSEQADPSPTSRLEQMKRLARHKWRAFLVLMIQGINRRAQLFRKFSV